MNTNDPRFQGNCCLNTECSSRMIHLEMNRLSKIEIQLNRLISTGSSNDEDLNIEKKSIGIIEQTSFELSLFLHPFEFKDKRSRALFTIFNRLL